MGCVRLARLTDIPVFSETEDSRAIAYMVLSVSGSTEGKINQTIF